MLTEDQIHHFRAFGFIILRQAFPANEVEAICANADELWTAELGHAPDPDEHISMAPFMELHPSLTTLIDDDRLFLPMTQLLGQDMIWSGSEGVQGTMTKRSYHHWHADRPGPLELGYLRIKIMMYLDPMRKDTGALRVLPGSHRSPFHEELMAFQQSHAREDPNFFGVKGADVPGYPVETNPGDLVLFSQSLFHAVYGKAGRRRYLAWKYAARPTTNAHLASIKKYSAYAYTPHEQLQQSDQPRIQSLISGLPGLGEQSDLLES